MRISLFRQHQVVLQLIHAAVLELLLDDYWPEEGLTSIGTFAKGVLLHVLDISVEWKCEGRKSVDRYIIHVRPSRIFQPFHFEFAMRLYAATFAVLSSGIKLVSKLTGVARGYVTYGRAIVLYGRICTVSAQ
jgi:hypothetical protein